MQFYILRLNFELKITQIMFINVFNIHINIFVLFLQTFNSEFENDL